MNAVIVFTKYPVNGNVKTRLGKSLGINFATDLFKLMAEHIFNECISLPEKDYSLFLFYTNRDEKALVKKWVDKRFSLHLQKGRDLGEKMKNAFRSTFKKDYEKVIIIGTDVPGINSGLLLKAFNRLSGNNVIIGPSADGGYYLIGMDNPYPFLFDNIEWSSEKVSEETIKKIKYSKLRFHLLPELIDIDTEEDLKHWLSKTKDENEMTKLIYEYGLSQR